MRDPFDDQWSNAAEKTIESLDRKILENEKSRFPGLCIVELDSSRKKLSRITWKRTGKIPFHI